MIGSAAHGLSPLRRATLPLVTFALAGLLASCTPPARGLLWPLDCELGPECSISNLPDLDRDGVGASCGRNSIRGHEGTDVMVSPRAAERGVAVFAAEDGVVLWAFDGKHDRCPDAGEPDCRPPAGAPRPGARDGTDVCTPLGPYCRGGASGRCFWCFAGGNVVVVRHDRPPVFATRYDHLRKGSVRVKAGQKVTRGQPLGLVASAGRSSGPHLHFEVWGKTFYDPVDPWKGPCGPSESLWERQRELSRR